MTQLKARFMIYSGIPSCNNGHIALEIGDFRDLRLTSFMCWPVPEMQEIMETWETVGYRKDDGFLGEPQTHSEHIQRSLLHNSWLWSG